MILCGRFWLETDSIIYCHNGNREYKHHDIVTIHISTSIKLYGFVGI